MPFGKTRVLSEVDDSLRWLVLGHFQGTIYYFGRFDCLMCAEAYIEYAVHQFQDGTWYDYTIIELSD
jgi:hypothetical protein